MSGVPTKNFSPLDQLEQPPLASAWDVPFLQNGGGWQCGTRLTSCRRSWELHRHQAQQEGEGARGDEGDEEEEKSDYAHLGHLQFMAGIIIAAAADRSGHIVTISVQLMQ